MPLEFSEAVGSFASEVQALLDAVLPGKRIVRVEEQGQSFMVKTDPLWLPLTVKDEPLAELRVWLACCADSSGDYLAVAESAFVLRSTLDREPLVWLEYDRAARTAPASHWQVHAERGAFSHLLAHAKAKAPHDLSSLHLPVGGARYRPCIEDFLQFLVCECGVDRHTNTWKNAVEAGRQQWRMRQIRTLVRDAPTEAAHVLEKLGYRIDPPELDHGVLPADLLCRW
ncbi:MAG: hypothetical protein ACRDPW_05625 [Mycobacteriales bacterium]